MLSDETQADLDAIDAINEEISKLMDAKAVLYDKVTSAEGICPHCRNWHYPHCVTAEPNMSYDHRDCQ